MTSQNKYTWAAHLAERCDLFAFGSHQISATENYSSLAYFISLMPINTLGKYQRLWTNFWPRGNMMWTLGQ